MFELVDVGPDFGLPAVVVYERLAATGAAGVELAGNVWQGKLLLKLDEDAAHLFDILVLPDHVFVAQDEAKTQLVGLALGFGPGVEWAVLGTQLLGRVTRHPKGFLVDHSASPRKNFSRNSVVFLIGKCCIPQSVMSNSDAVNLWLRAYFL